ncbi:MAG: hypothetical protein Ta2F_19090 [Termitinemataceae bacterium]|nr:MAG: hypothetical protein Ta2F_19090 [Termitinemataceae bacterium]
MIEQFNSLKLHSKITGSIEITELEKLFKKVDIDYISAMKSRDFLEADMLFERLLGIRQEIDTRLSITAKDNAVQMELFT